MTVRINGIGFNKEEIQKMSESVFVKRSITKYWQHLPEKERTDLLTEAYYNRKGKEN